MFIVPPVTDRERNLLKSCMRILDKADPKTIRRRAIRWRATAIVFMSLSLGLLILIFLGFQLIDTQLMSI